MEGSQRRATPAPLHPGSGPKKVVEGSKKGNKINDFTIPSVSYPKNSEKLGLVSEGRNEDNDSLVPPGFPPKFRMEAGCSMDKDGLTLSESLKHNNLDTRTCADIEKLSCQVQNLASSIAESSVDTLKSERLEAGGSMDEDDLTISELFKNYKKDKNVETRTCGDCEKLSAQIQNLTCSIAESSVDMLKSERSMTEDMVNIVLIGGCKAKGNLTNVMGSNARSSDNDMAANIVDNECARSTTLFQKRVSVLKARVSRLESIVSVLKENYSGTKVIGKANETKPSSDLVFLKTY
jgi:hypothetical protein